MAETVWRYSFSLNLIKESDTRWQDHLQQVAEFNVAHPHLKGERIIGRGQWDILLIEDLHFDEMVGYFACLSHDLSSLGDVPLTWTEAKLHQLRCIVCHKPFVDESVLEASYG